MSAVGRALERVGLGPAGTRSELERLGFFVCRPDLEGELIRSLGAAGVEAVLERSGKLSSFRTFQKQPQWQDRPVEDQLRRFFGSSAGKIRTRRSSSRPSSSSASRDPSPRSSRTSPRTSDRLEDLGAGRMPAIALPSPIEQAKRPLARPLRLWRWSIRPSDYSIGISKRAMMPGSPPLASSSGSGSRVATHAYPCSG